jgi:hypothetical protein
MPPLRLNKRTKVKDNAEATETPKVKASQHTSSTMEGSRQTTSRRRLKKKPPETHVAVPAKRERKRKSSKEVTQARIKNTTQKVSKGFAVTLYSLHCRQVANHLFSYLVVCLLLTFCKRFLLSVCAEL